MKEFHLNKIRKRVQLFMHGRKPAFGVFFLSHASEDHHGAERVVDLLSSAKTFLPFEEESGEGLLIQRSAIQKVIVDAEYELEIARSYGTNVYITSEVRVHFVDGTNAVGKLRIEPREGASRSLDEVNREREFLVLDCGEFVHLLAFSYISSIQETGQP